MPVSSTLGTVAGIDATRRMQTSHVFVSCKGLGGRCKPQYLVSIREPRCIYSQGSLFNEELRELSNNRVEKRDHICLHSSSNDSVDANHPGLSPTYGVSGCNFLYLLAGGPYRLSSARICHDALMCIQCFSSRANVGQVSGLQVTSRVIIPRTSHDDI